MSITTMPQPEVNDYDINSKKIYHPINVHDSQLPPQSEADVQSTKIFNHIKGTGFTCTYPMHGTMKRCRRWPMTFNTMPCPCRKKQEWLRWLHLSL